jgi:hypothetical protein
VRDIVTLASARRGSGSDAEGLAIRTHLPTAFWVLVFGALCLGCAMLAGRWLLLGRF